jgi:hypothetical protein
MFYFFKTSGPSLKRDGSINDLTLKHLAKKYIASVRCFKNIHQMIGKSGMAMNKM